MGVNYKHYEYNTLLNFHQCIKFLIVKYSFHATKQQGDPTKFWLHREDVLFFFNSISSIFLYKIHNILAHKFGN